MSITAFIEKYGEALSVAEEDFEAASMTDRERLDLQEECILELAELIGEMME